MNTSAASRRSCPRETSFSFDHAFITVEECDEANGEKTFRLLDFCFNGWGDKFPAALDNAINKRLFDSGVFNGAYENHLDFVLEGGSIESDGRGTVFTTAQCLLAPHRNQPLHRSEIDEQLCQRLGARRVVWLDHGKVRAIGPADEICYQYVDFVTPGEGAKMRAEREEQKRREAERRAAQEQNAHPEEETT